MEFPMKGNGSGRRKRKELKPTKESKRVSVGVDIDRSTYKPNQHSNIKVWTLKWTPSAFHIFSPLSYSFLVQLTDAIRFCPYINPRNHPFLVSLVQNFSESNYFVPMAVTSPGGKENEDFQVYDKMGKQTRNGAMTEARVVLVPLRSDCVSVRTVK
ncbi:hypothetical protein Fot_22280 [Forsythia ovata]|uniref:Uncharacterized protein n=1 Tax=Forsythia ovata TaxID=205694 RepID=A0ABD1UXA0_9LAMI